MFLLSEYERRTAWKHEPLRGTFDTAPGLADKVRPDGSYAPFPGSAAVFRPGKSCSLIVQLMRRALHARLDGTGMLASPLPASGIHMTLHDLISPEMSPSVPAEKLRRRTADSIRDAAAAVGTIRETFAGRKITMVSDRIVNMVSKSLVLLLRPRTERDGELLEELYGRFDGIRRLPYPLTPHITLAYFRPGALDGGALGQAVDAVQVRPETAPEFGFDIEGLTAQAFLDMKTCLDVPKRVCICCNGGLNRSVMAANILNHLAKRRGLPVLAEARSAFPNTQGRPVSGQVWETLESRGVTPDKSQSAARYLEEGDYARFSDFAGVTAQAEDRFRQLGIAEERFTEASRYFFGVPDPEYGEITLDRVFQEMYGRAEQYLDAAESGWKCFPAGPPREG